MDKKNIVISGYPKSGTTWLSRLVAELVSCPLQGDWGYEKLEAPYKEGMNRDSEYQTFKSHHNYQKIEEVSNLKIYKIIYILRDPRDITISGVYYFNFLPKLLVEHKINYKINKVLRKTYNRLVSNKEKKRQMIQAVLYGNGKINSWLTYSWKEHFTPYFNNNILFIKYEDLIDNPVTISKKILDYLGVEQSHKHILDSISNQSFQNRISRDVNKKDKHQKKLLRKGTYGSWEHELTNEELKLFKIKLKDIHNLYDI